MEYIFIIIFFLIILFTIIKIIHPIVKKKQLKDDLINFIKRSNLTYIENKKSNLPYDLRIVNDEKIFYIKLVIVPEHSEIQINNKSTWEVKYGAGDKIGKVQPHKRYLTEIIDFMRYDFDSECQKIVIFSPTPKKIVKYINENEIDFVTHKTDVYGAKITSIGKYDLLKK